jgi:hypothetical protein
MALTKATNSMISGARVNVFDYIPPEEHAAILDGTTTYDCTPAFIQAINYVRSLSRPDTGGVPFPPTPTDDFFQNKAALTGPDGATFCFSDSIVTPYVGPLDPLTDGFKNFDLLFEGCVFKALPSYNHSNSLIHIRGIQNFEIKGITFFGFNTSYVIFIDQHDANRGKSFVKYTSLNFELTEYGIRHELESCVAVIEDCLTGTIPMKQFLFVSRCDQMVIRDCSFEWWQYDLNDYDGFIEFGVDQYPDPVNPQTPGFGTYTVGRLLVDNCMFIPVANVPPVKSAWIKNVSGSVVVRACHFGPEANNRPITVLTSSPPALYGVPSSLVDTFIAIEDSSCATSYSLIYCLNDYPNKISIRNIRWFNGDYGNPPGEVRYALSGDVNLNSLTSKYTPNVSVFFNYEIDIFVPQSLGLVPVDPRLYWPRYVTTFKELAYGDNTNVNLANQALATFIILDPKQINEPFDPDGGLYSVSFTGNTIDINTADVGTASYSGYVEISISGDTMTCTWYEVYQSAFGPSSGISAQFYDLTTNTVSPTLSKTTYLSDYTNYALYMGFFAPTDNEWTSARIKIKRIT